jgi:hypothetical protein
MYGARFLNHNQINLILGMVQEEFKANISFILTLAFTSIVQPFIKRINKTMIYTGKLAIVKDPELKMRIIAMVDYLSQFIFKPIHEDIFKLLKTLPQDRTFTQDPNNNWTQDSEPFYSLDLSSATDRFPIVLQRKLLLYIYNDKNFVYS